MNKKLKQLLLAIFILALVAINLQLYVTNHKNSKTSNDQKEETTNIVDTNESNSYSEEGYENTITTKVTSMGERNRIQTYIGEYFTQIEEGNYSNAYSMLNTNFKNQYFKTETDFENYAKEKYPNDISLSYEDFERQGEIYVVTLKINDTFDKSYETINQRIVIRENGANSFTISFQAE